MRNTVQQVMIIYLGEIISVLIVQKASVRKMMMEANPHVDVENVGGIGPIVHQAAQCMMIEKLVHIKLPQ